MFDFFLRKEDVCNVCSGTVMQMHIFVVCCGAVVLKSSFGGGGVRCIIGFVWIPKVFVKEGRVFPCFEEEFEPIVMIPALLAFSS